MRMVNFSLEGKIALVTGGVYGIGFAIARALYEAGAQIVFNCSTQKSMDLGVENYQEAGIPAKGYLCDVTDETAVRAMVADIEATVGTIDILVNNAGITENCPTHLIKRDKLNRVMEGNTIAPILLTQRILKKKKLGKGGSIVFTCSISGTRVCVGGNVLYSASKGAIHGFMKNAALDLAHKGIRVNDVCPGMIDTHILDAGTISEEQLDIEAQRYPMKRFGKPEEVAYGIIYLLSDASSFVTGSSIVIDGGFTLQ